MRNREKEAIRKGRITPFQRKRRLDIYGRRAMCGQWRVFPYLVLTDDGKALNVSRHELYNYEARKKYPHSSVKQQVKELKRRYVSKPVDVAL